MTINVLDLQAFISCYLVFYSLIIRVRIITSWGSGMVGLFISCTSTSLSNNWNPVIQDDACFKHIVSCTLNLKKYFLLFILNNDCFKNKLKVVNHCCCVVQ